MKINAILNFNIYNLFLTFDFSCIYLFFKSNIFFMSFVFLNTRFTLYLIFIVTNDINFIFVIANDQRIKKTKSFNS